MQSLILKPESLDGVVVLQLTLELWADKQGRLNLSMQSVPAKSLCSRRHINRGGAMVGTPAAVRSIHLLKILGQDFILVLVVA